MTDLLSCPFCGSEAEHYHRDDSSGWSNTDWVCCENEECGGGTCLHETKDIAIAAWNRRALPPVDGLEVVGVSDLVERLDYGRCETANQWGDEYEPRSAWEEKVSRAMREWDRASKDAAGALSQASSVIAGLKEANEALMRERTSLIETKREQIERLTKERDEMVEAANSYAHQAAKSEIALRDAEARISSLEEENKRLRDALELNIDVAENYMSFDPDSRYGLAISSARQALEDHNG